MRIRLRFEPLSGRLQVPVHYQHLVQGFIYRNLHQALAQWLHNEGFSRGKRRFKLFTFSRLQASRRTYDPKTRTLTLEGPILLKIGSVDHEILESLAVHLVQHREFRLNGTLCQFQAIEVEMPLRAEGPVLVKTLSPITVYRTLYTREGKRKTYYFTPYEAEFEELLLDNLRRKAEAYYRLHPDRPLPPLGEASIKVVRPRKEVITQFKGTVIKAWTGLFELHLPEPYLTLAYDTGLGAKNSQGFGMVEVVKTSPKVAQGTKWEGSVEETQ